MRLNVLLLSGCLAVTTSASAASACELWPIALGYDTTDLVVGGVVTDAVPLALPPYEGDLDAVTDHVRMTVAVDRRFFGRGGPDHVTVEVVSRACTYQRVGQVGDRIALFLKRDRNEFSLQFTAWEDEVAPSLERMRSLRRNRR